MNSRDKGFEWHVNGLYVALGPDNGVYTDTAASTGHGARAALLTHTNKPWSKLQELGYSIQGYVQQSAPAKPPEHPPTAIGLLDRAVDSLSKAKTRLDVLQSQYKPGAPEWHSCETIDDHLHEALAALGQ